MACVMLASAGRSNAQLPVELLLNNAELIAERAASPFGNATVSNASSTRVIQVGPKRAVKMPSKAAAVARDGDTIEIDAGLYAGDVATWTQDDLTIRGVGGRAHLDGNGESEEGKGIWVIQGKNTTIENLEFSGATAPNQNGAGIRQEGAGLTLRNCYFHDNENGILTGANPGSDILIEYTEFARNGYGDGQTHNIYIGTVRTFTLRYSYSHQARIGHLVKSRAQTNYILYNRLTDESGTASYEINLPNGGLSYIIGNLIQQSPNTNNDTIISYAEEGASNPAQELYVVNNTIMNDYEKGTFVRVSGLPFASRLINNLFIGEGIVLRGPGTQTTNLATRNARLLNQEGYDYHLFAGSPAIDAGTLPGQAAGGYDLTPQFEYFHPMLSATTRSIVGSNIDIGAYEYGNFGRSPADTGVPSVPAGLTATAISSSQINLSWTASTDNVGVRGYTIYRGSTQIGFTEDNSYPDPGLTPSTTYLYSVSAYNFVGNRSARSDRVSGTTMAPPPSGTGLIAAYSLNEGAGTTAHDASGNGHNGTLVNGPTWVTGRHGSALSFNGVNNYINLEGLSSSSKTYTFEFWVNRRNQNCIFDSDNGHDRIVIDFGRWGTADNLRFNDGAWHSVGLVPPGAWHHVALVLDSASGWATGYVDGIKSGIAPYTGKNLSGSVKIGLYTSGADVFYSGLLDDFRLYTRPLSQSEIRSDMNTPVSDRNPSTRH
jgi:hypothetical protein